MRSYLDFEKPVAELEAKVDELRALAATGSDIGDEIARVEDKASQALTDLYANLTPWQKTLVARHPQRPHFTDFINTLITEFTPMAGDRKFGEDEALMGGFGRFRGESICVVGQEKGATTESRIKHNFGMARPEGYRKAVRLMEMADRFGIPVLSIVDSAGAYPGIGAEERGQAEAIARSTDACLSLGVPNVAIMAWGSRWAPPEGSRRIESITPKRSMSCAVIFMLVAASWALVPSRHRIDDAASGEITL